MPNVIVDKDKLDVLANAISAKSGEALTLTLDEMVEAVDGIETGGGGITPTGNINITSAGTTDVTNYATATVPQADIGVEVQSNFYTENGQRKWRVRGWAGVESGDNIGHEGYVADNSSFVSEYAISNAIPTGTSVTPTESAQTIGGANTMMAGAVTVNAIPSNYVGTGITRRSSSDLTASGATVSVPSGYYQNNASKAVASGTEGTPTATKGTVSGHAVSVTPSVTNTEGYISGGTHTGTAVSVSASELVSGTYNVSASGTADVTNYASVSVPNGTAGTPSATKGAVTNHSVSVTPSVTNSTGWITGSTKTGTAVSVSASELVSGSQTLSDNGTYDVTNLAEVVVDVQGGGGTVQVGTKTATLSAVASSIQFTGLSGNPTSFVITSSAGVATNTNGVTGVVWDGTSLHGQTITTQVTADTGFSKSYSSGTLTVTATTAEFQANEYKLVYTYGGTSSDVHTSDVQVGSGATSITFSSLSGRPIYWSCIFKSDFSTSSGYQRVIEMVNDGTSIYGMAMDSSAKAQTSWSATYSGGNLVITSTGTNNGGYFHQPGNYQLTYAVDASAPQYQSKTVSPSTSSQTVYPDSGYDALESVTVNAMPSMTLPSSASATSSGTSKATITPTSSVQYLNIPTGYNATAQYYTIGASGGGGDKNVQISQSTTRNNASSLTKANGDLTVSKTGTYDVYWTASRSNTSTSYTWGSQLYVGGSAYGSENTTWSNNVQNNHLSNVSLTANQKIAVYTRGRSGSYYTYAPMLVIVEA